MHRMFLALGMVVSTLSVTDALAQTTRIEKYYDNWKVECRDNEERKNCGLVYALLNRETKRVVFSWTLVPDADADDRHKAVVLTPMGVLLPEGITVTFPESDPVKLSYRTCTARGCVAEVTMSEQWIRALSSQETLTVRYKSVGGRDLQHEVNLAQFAPAYEFYTAEAANR
jgi:invasion protein IalB